MAPLRHWEIGISVTIIVDGTPVRGMILAGTAHGDESWVHDAVIRSDAWVVDVDGVLYAVVPGVEVRELEDSPAVRAVIGQRQIQ